MSAGRGARFTPDMTEQVAALLSAAETARRAGQNEAAVGDYQQALGLLAVPPLAETYHATRLAALHDLARTHLRLAQDVEAEQCVRDAIALGRGLATPREMARLFWLLGMLMQGRDQTTAERVALAREGLALLGEDTDCAEAALLTYLASGWGWYHGRPRGEACELIQRAGALAQRMPFPAAWAWTDGQKDYGDLIANVALAHLFAKDIDEALRLGRSLQEQAARTGDTALAGAGTLLVGRAHDSSGNTRLAQEAYRQAQALLAGTATLGERDLLSTLAWQSLRLGDLDAAEEHARAGLAREQDERTPWRATFVYLLAQVALCRGDWDSAGPHFEEARDIDHTSGAAIAEMALFADHGRLALAQGDLAAVARHDEAALRLLRPGPDALGMDALFWSWTLAYLATTLEEAGKPAAAWDELERLAQAYPVAGLPPVTLAAPPATPNDLPHGEHLALDGALGAPWSWQDPFGDGSYGSAGGAALEIRAPNGRDLWMMNLSAPRLLRPEPPDDFAIEIVCCSVCADRPACGGVLWWGDHDNYLVVERGLCAPGDVCLRGCLAGQDVLVGHALPRGDRMWLRLERRGTQVRALCSDDGRAWGAVGLLPAVPMASAQVGIYAGGMVDRTVYYGAFPDGPALRFTSVRVTTGEAG